MSAKSATGSTTISVQKWNIETNVEYQLRYAVLKERLLDESLSHGSIELYLRCPNLAAIEWAKWQAFAGCHSLLRVDLSGLSKLDSIQDLAFADCSHLVSVVFGEHSNITNLGEAAFQDCSALTSITLPNKLKKIEKLTLYPIISKSSKS